MEAESGTHIHDEGDLDFGKLVLPVSNVLGQNEYKAGRDGGCNDKYPQYSKVSRDDCVDPFGWQELEG